MLTEKELMIDDWVMYNPNVFIEDEYEPYQEWYPMKITSGEGIELAIEGCYAPIPLTTDILEKNGFTEIKGAYPTFKIDIYGYLIKVTFPKENKETNNGNPFLVIDSRPSYYSSECLYVHELQHVFKLLGIKKEIEL